ncbi:MAG TPA: trigger factor [Caulobacterales bacterium]|nr:trigger factor [Caulobacterales bacterium]
MQLKESRSEGLLRVYDVVTPAADLEQRLAAKIEEVRPRVRLNGFRPGKVPASHIRKMYGPSIMREIIDETVQKSTQAALEQAKVRPASEPQLELKSDINQVAAGQADLAFQVSVEVMPDFEPVDIKSISITRPVAPVEDGQVDDAVTELAKSQRSFTEKDGAAEDGDAVVVDFVGKIDGEAFEGGAAEDATIVIGSGQFIPGFEEQLKGAKAGEERVLKVTFPAEYGVDRLKGKDAEFDAKVKQVRAPKETEIDDDFAKQLGFEGLANLREAVRARIEEDHARQSRAKAKRVLFDKLDAEHSFELPPRMVEAEFAQIWRQIEQDRAAGQLDPSDAGKSEDELRAEYRRIAERRVRLGLLLAEIGRRNKIEVSEQEVLQEAAKMARAYPGRERQIFDMYQKNPNLKAQLRAPLYEEKVVSYILEIANVSNETVTREALFAEDEADAADAAAQAKPAKPARKKKAAEPAAEE